MLFTAPLSKMFCEFVLFPFELLSYNHPLWEGEIRNHQNTFAGGYVMDKHASREM